MSEGLINNFYSNKNVLITGGAGFVGSNLCHALAKAGAKITVIDNFHPDYGGNEYNLSSIKDRIELIRISVTDKPRVKEVFQNKQFDLIFHIAAQCSHVDSMVDPWFDIDYNCIGTLSVLEGARISAQKHGTKPSIIYAGTRAMIGQPLEMPATERTLPNPVDIYGVNKLAAELYGSVYARVHGLPFVSMRLTNCFGPRHQMKSGKYGILNWFVSLALQQKPVKVFGTGEQLRDYLYIDDAVDALLRAGEFSSRLPSQETKAKTVQLAGNKIPFAVFNIASGKGIPFIEAARKVVGRTNSPLEQIDWPAERKAIETGDFVANCDGAAENLNWKPTTSFDEGMDQTFAYYRDCLKHYI